MMVGIDQSDMRSQVAMVVDSIVRERDYHYALDQLVSMAPPVSSACLAEIHRQLSERRGALGQAAKDLERGVAEGQHGSRRPMIELLGFIVAAYDMLGAEFHVTKLAYWRDLLDLMEQFIEHEAESVSSQREYRFMVQHLVDQCERFGAQCLRTPQIGSQTPAQQPQPQYPLPCHADSAQLAFSKAIEIAMGKRHIIGQQECDTLLTRLYALKAEALYRGSYNGRATN